MSSPTVAEGSSAQVSINEDEMLDIAE